MNTFLSASASQLTPSVTLSVTNKAAELRAEGRDIAGLGAGEPDYDTPDHIKAAAMQALQDGKTKYTPAAGIPELRTAIAEKLLLENNIEYQGHQVVVSAGGKHAIFNALLATCGPGDEVLIPSPYWLSYPEMVRLTGAEPVIIETTEETGWKMTPEQFEEAMTPRTKMIILNSPSNPTGAVYSREELEKIAEVASYEDILILSDEIYEKITYGDAEHVSIASLNEEVRALTITINGFSKAYSMTGWRLGYSAAPEPIAKAISAIQSHTTSNVTSFAQYGALAALQGSQQFITDMCEEYTLRRQYMLQRLQGISKVSVVAPEGAFYFLINCESMGIKSVNLAEKLLSRYDVAAIPGTAFGHDWSLRFSYATGMDIIKKGLDRFEEFCHAH